MSRRARRVRQGGPNAGTHRSVGLPLRRRRQWHNNTGNQAVDAVCVVPARSVEELVAAVGRARDEGLTIRCVGSGHSWSDVALTTGYLVSPQHLGGVERVKKELLRSGATAWGQTADMRSADQVQAFITEAARRLGGLDILVANASAMSM